MTWLKRNLDVPLRYLLPCALLAFNACGGKKGDVSGPGLSPVEAAFAAASSESGVPVRMIKAIAFLESGLRSQSQSSIYLDGNASVEKSIGQSESAFGLSLNELDLTKGTAGSSQLSVTLKEQILAYGKFMKGQLVGTDLPKNAVTAEEKMRWIWKLAEIHRGKERQNRNLWAVFAREMMLILNEGFSVYDASSDGTIILEKEGVALTEEQLPSNYRQDLTLDTYHADIRPAYLFSLKSPNQSAVVNTPKYIEVVHCPLRLSACLNLQTKNSGDRASLSSHYVIPSSAEVGPGILQMSRHDESVELVNESGQSEVVSDRIVIVLAGFSGRYVKGIRSYADPTWLTDYQLKLLSATVTEVCASLERTQNVSFATCVTPGVSGGVVFRRQPVSTYRWGDIPEFDETIFHPYLSEAEQITATTTEIEGGQSTVEAGSNFKLNVKFQSSARRVEVERMVRCGGNEQRVVWESVENKPVRNVTNRAIEMSWYDAGPNLNGDQFFRAKVTGESGRFLGWSMQKVHLNNFSKESHLEGVSKVCYQD